MCVRCGSKKHLFERCWWGDPDIDDRAFFLYDCRQGLGPVATTLDCTDIPATPGFHVRDVLTREQAREIFNDENAPYFAVPAKQLDYHQFDTIQEEAVKVPATLQTGRGPPPSVTPRFGGIFPIHRSQDLQPLAACAAIPQPILATVPQPSIGPPPLPASLAWGNLLQPGYVVDTHDIPHSPLMPVAHNSNVVSASDIVRPPSLGVDGLPYGPQSPLIKLEPEDVGSSSSTQKQ
ncbi:hypothetical protein NUW58_g8281 [Xylaria curta]|uniref:Uncharacterized protein n=1 Tax=Xylaria curta TaxID=42375 RepID=A0ACC1NB72_9PEZI|nr:hypothetical protein NUW58_g8281 [Xylaria curta]